MNSLFDQPSSLSRSSSGPLPRSLDHSSTIHSSPAHHRQGSLPGLRRTKSPGRRLTDAYVRTASSGCCTTLYSDTPRHSHPDNDVQVVPGVTATTSSVIGRPEATVAVGEERGRPDLARPARTSSVNSAHSRKSTSSDSETFNGEMAKKKNKSSSSDSFITRIISTFFQIVYSILTFIVGVALIIFLTSFGVVWMRERCEELHREKFDLVTVRENFYKHIIGQDLAVGKIMSVLEEFHEDQFTAPAVMWCVGWTGLGKSFSMDVFRSAVDTQAHVQYFIPTFIPSAESALNTSVSDVISRMNPCLRDIVIVDGWDGEADMVIKFVSVLLAKVRERASEDPSVNQLLVVVSGVQGSKAINREYLSLRLQGIAREKLAPDAFITAAAGTKEYSQLQQFGRVTIVPYLPLEAQHVKQCVKRELMRFKRLHSDDLLTSAAGQYLSEAEEAELVASVIEKLPFTPQDQSLVSASGCKRVLSTLRIMLGEQQQASEDTHQHTEF